MAPRPSSTGPNAPTFPLIGWLQRRPRWQWRLLLGVVAICALWRLLRRRRRSAARPLVVRHRHRGADLAARWSSPRCCWRSLPSWSLPPCSGARLAASRRLPTSSPEDVAALTRRYRDRMGPAHRWLADRPRRLPDVSASGPPPSASGSRGCCSATVPTRHTGAGGRRRPRLLPVRPAVPRPGRAAGSANCCSSGSLATAFAYAVSGALRLPIDGHRSSPPALAHLGLLGAVLAGAQALDYVLVRRPAFAVDDRRRRSRAPATPRSTSLIPATWILAVVCIGHRGHVSCSPPARGAGEPPGRPVGVGAALSRRAARRRAGAVERFVVAPAEAPTQLPYLGHHLDATRAAYGLEAVEVRQPARPTACRRCRGIGASTETTSPARARCSSRTSLADALQVLQGTTATRITDVDLDRYDIDGTRPAGAGRRPRTPAAPTCPRTVGCSPTSCTPTATASSPCPPTQVRTTTAARTSTRLPTSSPPSRPQLYFGEDLRGWYAIVGTKRTEQDGARFAADTGIAISSCWRRAVLAVPVPASCSPLLSAELTDDSQLLYRRDVIERLRALAPFLSFDGDPYPVVTADRGGVGRATATPPRHVPVLPVRLARRASAPLGARPVNYVHASIRATVDAYDGTRPPVPHRRSGGADDPHPRGLGRHLPRARRADRRHARPSVAPAPALPDRPADGPDRAARPVPRRRRRDAVQRDRAVVGVDGRQRRRRRGPHRYGPAGLAVHAR